MRPKAAFVVDALPGMGGGERVVLHAMEMFPDAPIYTPIYNPAAFTNTRMAEHPVITSFVNHLPLTQAYYRSYLPLMMMAVQRFDLSQYDMVISFSYAVAHAARILPGQRHLSYTYTPMRYAWRNFPIYGVLSPKSRMISWFLNFFRKWDTYAAAKVDKFAAVSRDVAECIQEAYHRDAEVIYPPVDLHRFQPHHPREKFFITVSRLVAHKHIEIIVQACSALRLPLVVVGEGPELAHLRWMASPDITFTGYQPDEVVSDLLGRAQAYISAAEEDFGIAMVEAQAAGCPVITYQEGGACETVLDEKTGLFFKEQTNESLCDAIERFLQVKDSFFENNMIENAQQFGVERFKNEFLKFAGLTA